MDFNALRTKYEGYDDAEILGAIQATKYPDYGIDEIKAAIGYKPRPAGLLRTVGDVAVKGAQGVIGLGESVVGLADLATGGLAGRGLAAVGYDPATAKEMIGRGLSDAQKESDAKVQQADGIVDTVSAAVQNPRAILGAVAESVPSIMGMGAVARQMAVSIFSKAAATAGGIETAAGQAAGRAAVEAASGRLMWASSGAEGALTAGQIAETARQADPSDPAKMYYGVPAGIATGLIARGAGKLMGDAETAIFTGAKGAGVKGSFPVRVGKSVLSEGALEEMPQSAQEQAFTNLATGKPWDEGVGNAAGMGLLTGAAMGGGMAALQGRSDAEPAKPDPVTKGIADIAAAPTVDDAIKAFGAAVSPALDAPTLADRVATVRSEIADRAVMQAVRDKYGDEGASQFPTSVNQAGNANTTEQVREKHLQAVEDTLFQLRASRIQPAAGQLALDAPGAAPQQPALGYGGGLLQIGMNPEDPGPRNPPDGPMFVGPDGVARYAPSDVSLRDAFTGSIPRGAESDPTGRAVMVGDGTLTPGVTRASPAPQTAMAQALLPLRDRLDALRKKEPDAPLPDVPANAGTVDPANFGRGVEPGRSGGTVGLVPAESRRVDQPAAAPTASPGAAGPVADGSGPDAALTPSGLKVYATMADRLKDPAQRVTFGDHMARDKAEAEAAKAAAANDAEDQPEREIVAAWASSDQKEALLQDAGFTKKEVEATLYKSWAQLTPPERLRLRGAIQRADAKRMAGWTSRPADAKPQPAPTPLAAELPDSSVKADEPLKFARSAVTDKADEPWQSRFYTERAPNGRIRLVSYKNHNSLGAFDTEAQAAETARSLTTPGLSESYAAAPETGAGTPESGDAKAPEAAAPRLQIDRIQALAPSERSAEDLAILRAHYAEQARAEQLQYPAPTPAQPIAPRSFRTKYKVKTQVFREESGKFEEQEVTADAALTALDEDIAELEAFRRCIGG